MREVGAFEAKNKLGQLLDQVEHGEEIMITRRGRAVARLAPRVVDFAANL
jgi:prevent-host-death family protein